MPDIERLDEARRKLLDTAHLGPWARDLANRKVAELDATIRLHVQAERRRRKV